MPDLTPLQAVQTQNGQAVLVPGGGEVRFAPGNLMLQPAPVKGGLALSVSENELPLKT